MSISVCVATYGDKEWADLGETRALPSTMGDTYVEICQFHNPIGTVASSRNAAARMATEDWLCFLDADDELAPGYVGAMERALEQQGTDGKHNLLLTPAVQQIRKGRPGKPFFFPECSLTTGNWMVIGTLISREFFWEVGGFENYPHGLEDWHLWAKAVKAGAEIVRVPDAVYIAHVNPKSKHHVLMRDRKAHLEAYEIARASVWG